MNILCVYDNQNTDSMSLLIYAMRWFVKTWNPQGREPIKDLDMEMDFNDPDPCMTITVDHAHRVLTGSYHWDHILFCGFVYRSDIMEPINAIFGNKIIHLRDRRDLIRLYHIKK